MVYIIRLPTTGRKLYSTIWKDTMIKCDEERVTRVWYIKHMMTFYDLTYKPDWIVWTFMSSYMIKICQSLTWYFSIIILTMVMMMMNWLQLWGFFPSSSSSLSYDVILSLVYSHKHWQIPTLVGFCHGGNVPEGHHYHHHNHHHHHHPHHHHHHYHQAVDHWRWWS